jgi:hypothetical protein
MSNSSALDLIKRSLRLLGVESQGETPGPNESSEALMVLNQMIEQWSNEKLMLYTLTNNLFQVTAGITSYTMGPVGSGATWESSQVTRPLNIQRYAGFVRANTSGLNTDYAMDYYPNDRFQNIFQKDIQTNYPYAWTCDWGYPLATVRIYPKPTINLQFGLTEYAQLTKFGSLTDQLVMPPGYANALSANLAIWLSPEYGVEPNAIVIDMAKESKFVIKRANQQPVLMSVDRSLITTGIYSIYGDR